MTELLHPLQKRKKATDSGKSAKKYKEFKFWREGCSGLSKRLFIYLYRSTCSSNALQNVWFNTFISLEFFLSLYIAYKYE